MILYEFADLTARVVTNAESQKQGNFYRRVALVASRQSGSSIKTRMFVTLRKHLDCHALVFLGTGPHHRPAARCAENVLANIDVARFATCSGMQLDGMVSEAEYLNTHAEL